MSPRRMSVSLILIFAWLLGAALVTAAPPPRTRPVQGLRENTPQVHALIGARLVVAPGRVLEKGTVVVRDGVIVAAGAEVAAPADARPWKLDGKTVYAGLIDAYGEVEVPRPTGGAPYWNELVTPQRSTADHYAADAKLNEKLRGQGITARLAAPGDGVIKGTSALLLTGDQPNLAAIVRRNIAHHLRLTVPRGRGRNNYPNSPMGAVALARQALYDADWYRRAWLAYRGDPALPRPEQNDALEVLPSQSGSGELWIVDAPNELYLLRADRYAREFGLRIAVRGSGHEYKRLEAVKDAGRAVIVPLDFPQPPNVATAEAALNVRLDELMHWDLAPENPARLDAAGVKIALTSHGLEDPAKFLEAVRRAVRRGLPPTAALQAITTAPADILGVADRLGTIEAGKIANLVVTDGDLFDDETKVLATWVGGQRYETVAEPPLDLRGQWRVKLTGGGEREQVLLIELSGTASRLQGKLRGTKGQQQDEPIKLDRLGLAGGRFSCLFDSTTLGDAGTARLTAVVSVSETGPPSWTGQVVWPDGSRAALSGDKIGEPPPRQTAEDEQKTPPDEADQPGDGEAPADDEQPQQPDKAEPNDGPAAFPVNFPLGAFGRDAPPAAAEAVLFSNATVWTCGEAGVLTDAAVLIGGGRILAVGRDVEAPPGAIVVDCRGRHLTPGIVDCHSHMATDGGVNESTQAITAEVRIGDFVDADDIAIYRQLAGGVTCANILHGSANPIGGQNQVIKLRWGDLPESLKFAEAPAGIKFALGENVKQSNWGDDYTSRYPQTRMGVEQIIRDAFTAAIAYRGRWDQWQQTHQGLPPRRDLELDALAEIVAGRRWVHCHSYRQDEILALIRTLDDFGIQIGSFQHILEGYKVADAMARHGATGSAFSDWWAYKFEVYDAIPYAGALMHHAGVVVSFNSDDRELARHLNQEAAKAVKYGGLPPLEALQFVTLNPAKQLRIDAYVGSLEVGKHADLVVWSGPPLSNFSRCLQTWIDGRKYFDVDEDLQARRRAAEIRAVLVQKILASGEKMKSADAADKTDEELWPREDVFCHRHGHDHHQGQDHQR